MPSNKSNVINPAEAAAAFDANKFFNRTPEGRWYANRASKRATPREGRDFELDAARAQVSQQYPVEQVVQPEYVNLSEEEVRAIIDRVVQTGQLLRSFRIQAKRGTK